MFVAGELNNRRHSATSPGAPVQKRSAGAFDSEFTVRSGSPGAAHGHGARHGCGHPAISNPSAWRQRNQLRRSAPEPACGERRHVQFAQRIVDGLGLTERKNSGISRHGASLLSGASGRLDTRLDTPPSINRRHLDSRLALGGLPRPS